MNSVYLLSIHEYYTIDFLQYVLHTVYALVTLRHRTHNNKPAFQEPIYQSTFPADKLLRVVKHNGADCEHHTHNMFPFSHFRRQQS